MTEALLTLYCHERDEPALAAALRDATGRPVRVRAETVYARDFSDASTAESVTGQLSRMAITVQLPAADIEAVIDRLETVRRGGSARWHAVPVLASGKLS
jgi:hypothetical protein